MVKTTSKGFTLIETLAATAIFCLLFFVLLPNVKDVLDNFKLQLAAQKMAQDIRTVQQKSISEGENYKVLFDVYRQDNYQIAKGLSAKRVFLPKGVYLLWTNFPDNTLEFTPSGAPQQGGTVAIKNQHKRIYIIITVATGRVRISEAAPQ